MLLKFVLNYRLDSLLTMLVKAYFLALLFLYPYGIVFGGGNNFRFSDLVAFPLIFVSIFILTKERKFYHYPVLNSFVLVFICLEIFFPILGLLVGYEGAGAFSNTIRIILIWFPFYLYILLANFQNLENFEKFLNKVLKFAVILNLVYGIIQITTRIRILPPDFLITRLLEPFAVDSHFRVIDGIRASGFFVNTTGLSLFGVLAMAYFYSRYLGKQNLIDAYYTILSFVLIISTTSRAAVFSALGILFLGWFFLKPKAKLVSLSSFLCIVGILLFLIDYFIGLELVFSRFIRLIDGGAENDYSFSARSDRIWPLVFQKLKNYEYGTFVSAVSKIGLIDSGYLTYFAQGKWIFLLAIVSMFLGLLYHSSKIIFFRDNWSLFLVLCITLYVIFSMVVLNPMRSPLIIFFLLFGLWSSESYFARNEKN